MSLRHSLLQKPVLLSPVLLALRVVMMMMLPVFLEPREVMMELPVLMGPGPLVVVFLTVLPRFTATDTNSGFPGQRLLSPVFVCFICLSFLLGLCAFLFYLQHATDGGFLGPVKPRL